MAKEYSEEELILIKKIGLEAFLKSINSDYKKVSEGKKAEESADAETKSALIEGKGIFSVVGEGRLADVAEVSEDDVPSAVKAKLVGKAIDLDLRKLVFTVGDTYYVSASSREVAMRSMEKQGFDISKTDLTTVAGTRGARSRFNAFDNKHPKFYASGSYKNGGQGPRIQGPDGGPGSCKFVIIQRA
tara:strand:- start:105 stop:665 length:561 start_codon:yes stop_codon:yes gene_type:complete